MMGGALRRNDPDLVAAYKAYFTGFRILPLSSGIYEAAADFVARHNLRPMDALHLAAASVHGCAEIWTNDHRIARAAPSLGIVPRLT